MDIALSMDDGHRNSNGHHNNNKENSNRDRSIQMEITDNGRNLNESSTPQRIESDNVMSVQSEYSCIDMYIFMSFLC